MTKLLVKRDFILSGQAVSSGEMIDVSETMAAYLLNLEKVVVEKPQAVKAPVVRKAKDDEAGT